MLSIVQKDHPVLRQKAEAVPLAEIGGGEITRLIDDMKEALARENDGVGLAAPQLGVALRIFIVSELAFRTRSSGVHTAKEDKILAKAHLVYINPEILSLSKDKKSMDEGCLSVRPLFGKVRRATRAKIRAYDEFGNQFERSASGLLAHIYQHEVDHLDGVLFTDKAKDLHDMPLDPENPTTQATAPKKKKTSHNNPPHVPGK